MRNSLTPEQIESVVDRATGYVDGFERVLRDESIGLEVDELEELLLDNNVEKCPECAFFVVSHELLNDEGEIDGHCDNCRT